MERYKSQIYGMKNNKFSFHINDKCSRGGSFEIFQAKLVLAIFNGTHSITLFKFCKQFSNFHDFFY